MPSTKIINVVKDDSFDEIFDLLKNSTAEEVIFILPKKAKAFTSDEQFEQMKTAAQEQEKRISIMSSNPETISLARQYGFEVLQDKSNSSGKQKTKARKAEPEPVPVLASADEEQFVREDSDLLDPLNPSDGIMGIPDPDEEEEVEPLIEGEDIETPEVKDEPLELEEELLEDEEKEDVEEDVLEEDELEEVDKEEDDIVDDTEEEVGLISDEYTEEPIASLANARKFDGLVTATGESRSLRIPSENQTIKLGVKKGKVNKRNLEEIAEVWQHEPFAKGDSMWTGILTPKGSARPSLWSRMFSRKPAFALEKQQLHQASKSSRSRKIIASTLVVAFLLAGGTVYAVTGSAEIVIIPMAKKLDFDMNASVSDQFASVDATFGKLPGQVFSIEKTVVQEFPATGEREVAQKARGKITIYNTFSSAPQTLIATTRFESTNNLIFHTLRTVTVPGMSGATPGSVEVEIIADKAGTTYNIAPGRFTIPAFKEKGDTARYQKFYGQSTEAMKDGISGVAKVVTEQDYAQAKEVVNRKLDEEIKQALSQEASGLKIADSAPITIISTESNVQVDQAADMFTVTTKGKLKTMGFKEEDVWVLIREHVAKNYGLTAVSEKMTLEYKEAKLNEARGILELTLKLSGNGYSQINNDQITTDLLGKGQDEIVAYLKQAEGVGEAKVLLTPFWVKKVPKNKEKVKITIEYQ